MVVCIVCCSWFQALLSSGGIERHCFCHFFLRVLKGLTTTWLESAQGMDPILFFPSLSLWLHPRLLDGTTISTPIHSSCSIHCSRDTFAHSFSLRFRFLSLSPFPTFFSLCFGFFSLLPFFMCFEASTVKIEIQLVSD